MYGLQEKCKNMVMRFQSPLVHVFYFILRDEIFLVFTEEMYFLFLFYIFKGYMQCLFH